jgi:hypothetical protein
MEEGLHVFSAGTDTCVWMHRKEKTKRNCTSRPVIVSRWEEEGTAIAKNIKFLAYHFSNFCKRKWNHMLLLLLK